MVTKAFRIQGSMVTIGAALVVMQLLKNHIGPLDYIRVLGGAAFGILVPIGVFMVTRIRCQHRSQFSEKQLSILDFTTIALMIPWLIGVLLAVGVVALSGSHWG